jgi:hypothetical protein
MPPVAPLGGDRGTCAFSRRPFSRAYRPFIGPTFKARSGSILAVSVLAAAKAIRDRPTRLEEHPARLLAAIPD